MVSRLSERKDGGLPYSRLGEDIIGGVDARSTMELRIAMRRVGPLVIYPVSFQNEYGAESKENLSCRHLVKEEATQVIELGSSNQVEVEGSSENVVELDNLRKEGTSMLEFGRRLGLSYGSNESEVLQQVFIWEVEEAYGSSSQGIYQKLPKSEGVEEGC